MYYQQKIKRTEKDQVIYTVQFKLVQTNENKYTEKSNETSQGVTKCQRAPTVKQRRVFSPVWEEKQAVGSENERVMSGLMGIP